MELLEKMNVSQAGWDAMSSADRADLLFNNGLSCAQSVLTCFADRYDMDGEKAVEVSRAFGSGMGLGFMCGAVVGAFMVIGLAIDSLETERQTRYRSYDLVNDFIRLFTERNRAIDCKDLLNGVDLSTDDGRRIANEKHLFTTVCPKFVKDAADILDGMFPQNGR